MAERLTWGNVIAGLFDRVTELRLVCERLLVAEEPLIARYTPVDRSARWAQGLAAETADDAAAEDMAIPRMQYVVGRVGFEVDVSGHATVLQPNDSVRRRIMPYYAFASLLMGYLVQFVVRWQRESLMGRSADE